MKKEKNYKIEYRFTYNGSDSESYEMIISEKEKKEIYSDMRIFRVRKDYKLQLIERYDVSLLIQVLKEVGSFNNGENIKENYNKFSDKFYKRYGYYPNPDIFYKIKEI